MSQLTNESGTHRCGTGVYEDQILDGLTHMKVNPSDDDAVYDCDIENSHEYQSQQEYQGR